MQNIQIEYNNSRLHQVALLSETTVHTGSLKTAQLNIGEKKKNIVSVKSTM